MFHPPGWVLPNGHSVRTRVEASLCQFLAGVKEPHIHGSPESHSFEVVIGPRRRALFVPSIILTGTKKEGGTILIEPVDSIQPGGGVRRLQGFRQAYGAQYFLIVIARRSVQHKLPPDAYDLLLPLEEFGPLGDFLDAL